MKLRAGQQLLQEKMKSGLQLSFPKNYTEIYNTDRAYLLK